ncbi:MAG: PfkB family carbohydrate kinase [Caulobacteraceae bacterium]
MLRAESRRCSGKYDLIRNSQYVTALILVTVGADGCFCRKGNETGSAETIRQIKAVDTTGAGDAFQGAEEVMSLINEAHSASKQ